MEGATNMKEDIEREDILAPYAMRSRETRGRKYPEEKHPYRTIFQRDRDRVIHSSSFRRLEYKTQVFVYHEGDYYRTRLTHTIEVAQITRSIAKALKLNEDLAEAIALAHDLGHPPFGHSGEKTLNALMSNHGGFEHNKQSLRIVDYIEHRYPSFRGLNLSWEVREGIAKHSTSYDSPDIIEEFDFNTPPCLEAQIVILADEIAYNSHDLDDGLTSKMIDGGSLSNVTIWKENLEQVNKLHSGITTNIKKYQIIRYIINQQVTDMIANSINNLEAHHINSIEDVRKCKTPLLRFSSHMDTMNKELRDFLYKNLYQHYRVIRMENKAKQIIEMLFNAYINRLELLPPNISKKLGKEDPYRLVCDYIAGMTDRYAMDEYKKLFDPYEKV